MSTSLELAWGNVPSDQYNKIITTFYPADRFIVYSNVIPVTLYVLHVEAWNYFLVIKPCGNGFSKMVMLKKRKEKAIHQVNVAWVVISKVIFSCTMHSKYMERQYRKRKITSKRFGDWFIGEAAGWTLILTDTEKHISQVASVNNLRRKLEACCYVATARGRNVNRMKNICVKTFFFLR